MSMTSTTKAKINDATMTTIVELCNCAKVGQDAFSTSSLFFEIRSDDSRIRQRDKIIPCDNDMI